MKKILLICSGFLLLIIVFLIFKGNFKIKPNQNSKVLEQTEFFKNFYNTDKTFIVEVWSPIPVNSLQEGVALVPFFEKNNLEYVSFSNNTDLDKIKNSFTNNKSYEKYDLTLDDFDALDKIFDIIKFKEIDNSVINVSANRIPYIVIIKNKKVLYTANEFNSDDIENVLNKIKM